MGGLGGEAPQENFRTFGKVIFDIFMKFGGVNEHLFEICRYGLEWFGCCFVYRVPVIV